MRHVPGLAVLTLAVILGGCSAEETKPPPPVDVAERPASTVAPASVHTAPNVLLLSGLGDLRIGEAPPNGGSWTERGAQIDEACRTLSSPDYPGVYAIVTGGKVRRITLGQRSDIKLAEGVGVGASEGDVRKAFAGFDEEPHKYVAAPAKYLTAPNAASGDPALRFEIGEDGKVSLIHVGTMPELAYVEGCA